MQRKREKRWEHLQELYNNRLGHYAMSTDDLLVPTLPDLLELPPFKKLLEEDDGTERIAMKDWEVLSPNLVLILLDFQKSVANAANAAVSKTLDGLKETQTETAYSTIGTNGYCTKAYSIFALPGPCYDDDELEEGGFVDVLAKARRTNFGWNAYMGKRTRLAWKGEDIRCSKLHTRIAIALLKDMGMDWESTPLEKMLDMGESFGCARCPTVTEFFSWFELVI